MDMGSREHSSCTLKLPMKLLLWPVFISTVVHTCECFVTFILFREKLIGTNVLVRVTRLLHSLLSYIVILIKKMGR